jgi:O-antigen/teichoic acid export membrane protein
MLNPKKYLTSSFKNISVLFIGSLIANVLVFIFLPVLTRLFSAETFGVLAIYSSIVFFISSFSALRLELSVVLPKKNSDAINLLFSAVLIVGITSSVLFVVIFFMKIFFKEFLDSHNINDFLYLIPFSVLFLGIITSFDYWNNRLGYYKKMSLVNVCKSTSVISSQFILYLIGFVKSGLIIGLVIGQFISFLTAIKFSYKSIRKEIVHISIQKSRSLLKSYKDIPIYNTIISSTNTLSNELPIYFFGIYFGAVEVGLYAIAFRVLKVPVGMISNSISQVFLKEVSYKFNRYENLYNYIRQYYIKMLVLGVVIFVPLFISSYYTDFFLGNEWEDAGIYMRLLIPLVFIGFLNSPASNLVSILNRQKQFFILDILLLLFRFSSLMIGVWFSIGIFKTLTIYVSVGLLFNIIYLIYFIIISKKINRESIYNE